MKPADETLPYPLVGAAILILAWPMAFSGQWDLVLLIGAGVLAGLGLLLVCLRPYTFSWDRRLLWPVLLLGWIVAINGTSTTARDSAWPEVFWWVIGTVVLLWSAQLSRVASYKRLIFFSLTWLHLLVAIIAIGLWAMEPGQRAFGLQFNANGYAGVALWGLAGWMVLVRRRDWFGRRALLGAGVVFGAFCLTISLTAAIAAGATGLTALWLHHRQLSKSLMIRLSIGFTILILLIAGLWQIPTVRVLMDAEHMRFSYTQRLDFSRAAIAMGMDRPLTGWGPGSFQLVYPRYANQPNEQPRYPHNLAAQMLAEFGWLGLVGWLSLLVMIGRAGWWARQASRDREREWFTGLWYGWLAFTLMTFIDFNWQFPAGQIAWWVVSGIFLGTWLGDRRSSQLSFHQRLFLAVLALGLLGWTGRFALSHLSAQAVGEAENNHRPAEIIQAWESSVFWQPNRFAGIQLVRQLWLRRDPGDLEQASDIISRLAARNSSDYSIAYWEGIIAHAQKDDTKALHAFRRAYELDPVFHLEHAIEYVRALERVGDTVTQRAVIDATLDRYQQWSRFNQNSINEQLETLRQLRP